MAKNQCHYCFGHGISKYWYDTGMAPNNGERHPVRLVLKVSNRAAYACEYCQKPKDLPPCPSRAKTSTTSSEE